MKFKNLQLVGTSHIAKESIEEVTKVIEKVQPAVVALELDPKRLHSLLQKKKQKIRIRDVRRVGVKGWLFALIGGWLEKKLGEKVGVTPGSDMLQAFKVAKKNNIRVALIDQDIEITLRRISQSFGWKERWNLVVDIVKGALFKKGIKIDLSKVPDKKLIEKMIKEVKVRYPNLYKVLIQERNEVMH